MRYHYTLIGMVKYKNLTKSITGKDEEQQKLSFIVSGNAKWYSLWKQSLNIAKHCHTIWASDYAPR